jgi:hypothetical protein
MAESDKAMANIHLLSESFTWRVAEDEVKIRSTPFTMRGPEETSVPLRLFQRLIVRFSGNAAS